MDGIGEAELAAIGRIRAAVRELAWPQRVELTGKAAQPNETWDGEF